MTKPDVAPADPFGGLPPKVLLGIFGGMGPAATADCYAKVVAGTPATRDQEHIPTLMYSLPQVPDRSTAIHSGDRAIVPWLLEGVTRLERAGASFIIIPCNTVHHYFADMQAAVAIPLLNMIELTARAARWRHPEALVAGLLATSGTLATDLYGLALAAEGFQVLVPEPEVQEEAVMAAIGLVKEGGQLQRAEDLLARAADHLTLRGAEVLVLGCTETPLAFNPARAGIPAIDATRVLAEAAVAKYREMEASK
jgi:aspartate racemase